MEMEPIKEMDIYLRYLCIKPLVGVTLRLLRVWILWYQTFLLFGIVGSHIRCRFSLGKFYEIDFLLRKIYLRGTLLLILVGLCVLFMGIK